EGGEARHAGDARRGTVGEIEIPEVGEVEAGAERRQHVLLFQRAFLHVERRRRLVRRRVRLEAELLRRARRHQRIAQRARLDQRHAPGLDEAVALEPGREAGGGVLLQRDLRREALALLHAKQRALLRLLRARRERAPL